MFIICVQFELNYYWPEIRCRSGEYTDRFSQDWIQKDAWSFERAWNACSGKTSEEEFSQGRFRRCQKHCISLKTIQRRKYNVKGSKSLWHIEGNHKLIRLVAIYHLVFHTKKQSEKKQSQILDYFEWTCQDISLGLFLFNIQYLSERAVGQDEIHC